MLGMRQSSTSVCFQSSSRASSSPSASFTMPSMAAMLPSPTGYGTVTAHEPKLPVCPGAVAEIRTEVPNGSDSPQKNDRPVVQMRRLLTFPPPDTYTQSCPVAACGLAAVPGQLGVEAPPWPMMFTAGADGSVRPKEIGDAPSSLGAVAWNRIWYVPRSVVPLGRRPVVGAGRGEPAAGLGGLKQKTPVLPDALCP